MIDPWHPALLRPCSYVLRLGSKGARWSADSGQPIRIWSDAAGASRFEPLDLSQPWLLRPGDLVLACTLETISIPTNCAGFLSNLSHLARFGLSAHGGSLLVAPGFGRDDPLALTLELLSSNPAPLELQPGIPIAHLVLADLGARPAGDESVPRGIYEGLPAPHRPLLFEEFAARLADDG